MTTEDFKVVKTPDGRTGVMSWSADVYYVPGDEDGYQWHSERGRLSAMSYGAFGSDAYNAERGYKCWLTAAKKAAKDLIK